MSDTHGLLQPNQPGYYYITLEESYVTLFKLSADDWYKAHKNEPDVEKNWKARLAHAVAKAYITDVLVNLSNDLYVRNKSEKNLWVFLSFPQLESRLHDACKMRVLKDAMKEMIEDGYVYKRPNRNPKYKTLEYRLHLAKYRKELASLPRKGILEDEDSADLHDEIDSAKMHDHRADLHDHRAKMHQGRAETHAIHNIDRTNTKQETKQKKTVASLTNQEPDTTTTTNPSLLEKEKNNGTQEEQPLEQLPWGAEKALKTIETLVDTTYLDQQKELAACTKILATYQPTLEEYIAVVQKILGWWKGNKGILRPSDLLGKNSKTGNVRFVELLEEVRYQNRKPSTPQVQVMKNQQLSREELMAKALAFPLGMDHTTKEYEELQNCLMYLQPDDRADVTRQRIAKQIQQQKKPVNA